MASSVKLLSYDHTILAPALLPHKTKIKNKIINKFLKTLETQKKSFPKTNLSKHAL